MRVSNTFLLLHHLIVLLPLVFRSLALVIFEESKIFSLNRFAAIYTFCDLSYLFVFVFFLEIVGVVLDLTSTHAYLAVSFSLLIWISLSDCYCALFYCVSEPFFLFLFSFVCFLALFIILFFFRFSEMRIFWV